MKKEKIKTTILILGLFIFTFILNFYGIANNDLIWNYGFSYNVSKGLLMYKDFNMVITPLFPFIIGNLMKLIGMNTITFYLLNSIIPTLIFYIIHKYYKNVLLEMVLLITFISGPNYNLLCLLLLFILFVLEDKNKNDYIIGFVLGLAFLTKSCMGLLCLSSLYYKDIKKIIKRIIGFLIPNILFIIYFYKLNILKDYINYAFGSLFDFASKNFNISLGIIIFTASIIYLIYLYKKNKDIKILYILFFQIMSYPIFNLIHIIFSIIPTIFYILLINKNNFYLKYRKYLLIILLCPILSLICQLKFIDMDYGTNALRYKLVENKYIKESKIIKENVNNLNNTYFIMYEGYYNKLLLNLNINKYDVMLSGNLGYDGENKTIKYFDSLPIGTKFLLYNEYEGGQSPKKIYDHITSNYNLSKTFGKYKLYIK